MHLKVRRSLLLRPTLEQQRIESNLRYGVAASGTACGEEDASRASSALS
jgi:hypothetical protein